MFDIGPDGSRPVLRIKIVKIHEEEGEKEGSTTPSNPPVPLDPIKLTLDGATFKKDNTDDHN